MSQIDPVSMNKIAEKRPVILFDNAGIGRSTGQVPTSYSGWAGYCAELIMQLGFKQVDIVAFFDGWMRSSDAGFELPNFGIRMAHDRESQEAALLELCRHSSETSRAAERATFRRMLEARDDWSDLIDTDGTRRQIQAFAKFMSPRCSSEGSYQRFHELRVPEQSGSHDYVLEKQTCQAMVRQICNTAVSVYEFPDAGHAPHWQYPEEFADLVDCFLCAEDTLKVPEMPVNWVRWINGTDVASKI
ncbi:hypothetical protein CSAL01_01887 [Colletotrichum salicis]|uniref:AB hydrolase-1 domain-containing protein n=1 Tax=Colletotrichum salicis TaxID=1209931 RepID=A0A135V9R8_9PEZI|nr:hypothetical protein CSAL01_01887 [Colletotrichum salicis]